MISTFENPFSVHSPEEISAEDMRDLFVGGFTDFEKVPLTGHTFLHGPRGCGKSMMFRFMQPDSQSVYLGKGVHELPYCGAYVPIKNMGTNRTELNRLEGHAAEYLFNEHILCVYILEKISNFFAEASLPYSSDLVKKEELEHFYNEVFRKRLDICHLSVPPVIAMTTPQEMFKTIAAVAEEMSTQINVHIKQLS